MCPYSTVIKISPFAIVRLGPLRVEGFPYIPFFPHFCYHRTMHPNYSAENITVLKDLEPVRKRPGMYIGTTGIDGLHHLVFEVVDNSVDEAMQGFCSEILVVLEGNDIVRVEDNGRGIPVDIHSNEGVSAL